MSCWVLDKGAMTPFLFLSSSASMDCSLTSKDQSEMNVTLTPLLIIGIGIWNKRYWSLHDQYLLFQIVSSL